MRIEGLVTEIEAIVTVLPDVKSFKFDNISEALNGDPDNDYVMVVMIPPRKVKRPKDSRGYRTKIYFLDLSQTISGEDLSAAERLTKYEELETIAEDVLKGIEDSSSIIGAEEVSFEFDHDHLGKDRPTWVELNLTLIAPCGAS